MVWREQPQLVGRDRELSTLARLLEEARRGHSGVVLVAGEPGIGKTRLLLEFAQGARANDRQVLLGSAYDSDGMPPYLPFIETLHDYLRTCRSDELRCRTSHPVTNRTHGTGLGEPFGVADREVLGGFKGS